MKQLNLILHYLMWYKTVYYDMNNKQLFFRKSTNIIQKVEKKSKILKEFWHLKYFFKRSLLKWQPKKISTNNFIAEWVKATLCKQFLYEMTHWKDKEQKNINVNTLLEN